MTTRPARTRHGKSLIEMLVVIALMAFLLGTAAQVLYRLARVERSGREAGVAGLAELRLARDFRRDVRSSGGPADAASDHLSLDTPAGVVRYEASADGVVRTVRRNGAERPDAVEAYRLGLVETRFSRDGDRLVALSVRPKRGKAREVRFAAGPLRIVAAVGADRAAARPEEGQPARPPVEAPRPTSSPEAAP